MSSKPEAPEGSASVNAGSKHALFEPVALLLLSLATVGTAWCSFQAFVTNLYQPRLLAEAGREEAESQRLWQQAGEAGRTSRNYVLITVLLASALFCGGTASKFDALWIRRSVLALGLTAFLFATGRLCLLPVQL